MCPLRKLPRWLFVAIRWRRSTSTAPRWGLLEWGRSDSKWRRGRVGSTWKSCTTTDGEGEAELMRDDRETLLTGLQPQYLHFSSFSIKLLTRAHMSTTFRSTSDELAVRAEYCESLRNMLPRCDYVIVTVCLTPDTRKMFGEEQFRIMKPSAIFVNIARGN